MRYTKKIVSFLLSAMLAISGSNMTAFAKPDWPSDTGVESEAGIVMDMNSGAVLFAQNIHMQKAPASITKILTALVVLEQVDESKMGDMVTFSHDAVYNVESGSGNKKNIEEGDQLSVEDCLYLLLLQSSNQVANALAEYVAGDRESFVDLMNQKVKELGCTESHFANPSGLNDETQLTTAYDMALIARAAYSNKKLLEISSTLKHKLTPTKNNPNGATVEMEHKMLLENDENYYPDAICGKTGFTSIAGQTLVTYAKREEREQITVTLKSTAWTHYKDTKTLMEFGFDRFKNLNISQNETWLQTEEPVEIGSETYQPSELSIDSEAVITVPNEAQFSDAQRTVIQELPDVHPDGAVAVLEYTYNDRKIGNAYVYSSRQASVTDPSAGNGEEIVQTDPTQDDLNTKDEEEKKPISVGAFGKIVAGILLAFAAIAVVGIAIFFYHKKKEEERLRQEKRKARRRRVLEETGCSEAEFERMLSERMGYQTRKSLSLEDDNDSYDDDDSYDEDQM